MRDGGGFVAQLEQAASDLVSSLRIQRPVPEGEEDLQERHDVQVLLHSTEDPMTLRKLSVRHPPHRIVVVAVATARRRRAAPRCNPSHNKTLRILVHCPDVLKRRRRGKKRGTLAF
jgi:hypothetical protein